MSEFRFDFQRVRPAERVLSQTLGGEAVLLDLKSEQYFGLDPTGTRIWELIHELSEVDRIFEHLVAEYDAPADAIATDLNDLLSRLATAGLIDAE
jgi:hypothetical protein